MDRGAWWATVHGVTKNWTQLKRPSTLMPHKSGCFQKHEALLVFSCFAVSNPAISQTAACQASLSFSVSQGLLKLMSIESTTPSTHLILICPLILLPSILPILRVFSNESINLTYQKIYKDLGVLRQKTQNPATEGVAHASGPQNDFFSLLAVLVLAPTPLSKVRRRRWT